ncbi:MAG TPA: DUF3060 domain-containing protein [Chitinophagales bacterium]|nr:DUF3060 domain-containing protein [Chitinophagales bacterium]HMU98761.1 DUF3060 domain-containing protein [Chitinophagales bacterium]HMV02357.1 DUF3060 domain-containing protein [Chitinophagales bacterium]HMW94469.1 DUF3060 domain-containing protein [Chitinophagales bacterium]HMY42895.1 DUF3060 domain-containing protein [Chitinophagales bacterium]
MRKLGLLFFTFFALIVIAGPPEIPEPKVKNATILDAQTIIINLNEDDNIQENANHQDILISGISNKINIKGNCKKVLISGMDNEIILDTVQEIILKGNRNTLTWNYSKLPDNKPIITDKGFQNKIEQKTIE